MEDHELMDLTTIRRAPALEDDDAIEVPADATPLDFLQRVYRDSRQPLSTRIRAAGLAAPFCHPKLAVTVQVEENGDIAQRIDRARQQAQVLIEARIAQAVEARLVAKATTTYSHEPLPPSGRTPTPMGAPMSRLRRI